MKIHNNTFQVLNLSVAKTKEGESEAVTIPAGGKVKVLGKDGIVVEIMN